MRRKRFVDGVKGYREVRKEKVWGAYFVFGSLERFVVVVTVRRR